MLKDRTDDYEDVMVKSTSDYLGQQIPSDTYEDIDQVKEDVGYLTPMPDDNTGYLEPIEQEHHLQQKPLGHIGIYEDAVYYTELNLNRFKGDMTEDNTYQKLLKQDQDDYAI